MSNSLEERLRSNSSAFDGLLSLIPAKYYYDDKTQEQWKAKKKSKSQSKKDKKNKLNPEEQDQESSSALEVMKKKESNAKPVVLPGEKLKTIKKQREEKEPETNEKQHTDEGVDEEESINIVFDDEGNEVSVNEKNAETEISEDVQVKEDGNENVVAEAEEDHSEHKNKTKKELSDGEKAQKQKNLEQLRAKLQEKIKSMKEKRKAPGTKVDGAPSSREAILAQRKKKEELKKRKSEEGKQKQEESSDDSDSDSDSELEDQPPNKKQRKNDESDGINAKQVMFQNIVFDDGDRATSDLQRLRKGPSKKGPARNDIKAHLKLAEAKKARLEDKDELEQIKLKEKEKWQKAMLQAEGVKVRDDEKLLRKALKRKEVKKRKSTVEWRERKETVANTIAERQKRREENLQIRRDNKGKKRSQQQSMKRKFKGTAVPKKRAGFEGRLKSGKKK